MSYKGKKQRAGQLGGLTTLMRYGKDYFSRVGKLGGRPSLPTLTELRRQQSAPEITNTKKEGMVSQRSFSLKKLKELWKDTGGELAAQNSSPRGGG